MTNELQAALWGGFAASLLTFLTAWRLDKLKENRVEKQRKKYFTQAIIDDLEASEALYEKIENDWNKTDTIWLEYIAELRERRQIYLKFQELILLYPDSLRKNITNYYIKTGKLLWLLECSQNRIGNFVTEYENILNTIKLENPTKSDETAKQEAYSYVCHRQNEFANLRKLIETKLADLKLMSTDRKLIIDQLKLHLKK